MRRFLYDFFTILPIAVILNVTGSMIFAQAPISVLGYLALVIFSGILSFLRTMTKRGRILTILTLAISGGLYWLIVGRVIDDSVTIVSVNYLGIINALFASFFALGMCYFMSKIIYIRYAFALIFVVLTTVAVVLVLPINNFDTAMFILFVTQSLADIIQRTWKKTGDTAPTSHMVNILPFILILCAIVCIIPAHKKPYDWAPFKKAWAAITKEAEALAIKFSQQVTNRGIDEYVGEYTGFSEAATIGDNKKKPDKTTIDLVFQTDITNKTIVYLSGITFDSFDGRTWSQTFTDTEDENAIDGAETLSSIQEYIDSSSELLGWQASDFYRMISAAVTYSDINTCRAFAPNKTVNFLPDDDNDIPVYENGCYAFSELSGYNTKYNINFLYLNTGSDGFRQFVNSNHNLSPEKVEKCVTQFKKYSHLNSVTYDDIVAHRDNIYSRYLINPDISDEAAAYIDAITLNAETDMDKAMAIANVLRSYEYTLKPGAFPEDISTAKDYLDYFLFKNPKGYCMHFATAFTLMARQAGIPTRYVQGYYVNSKGRRTVKIHPSNAHAWAECYIDGVGWLIFDATPGYGVEPSDAWSNAIAGSVVPTPTPSLIPSDDVESDEYSILPIADSGRRLSSLALIIVLIGVAVFVGAFFAERAIASARFKRLEINKRVSIMCRENLRLMKLSGYTLNAGETLSELDARSSENLSADERLFIEIYEKLLYSHTTCDSKDADTILASRSLLLEGLKARKGRFIWLLAKFTLR